MKNLKPLQKREEAYKLLTRFVQILNAVTAVRFKRFKTQVVQTLPYHRYLEHLLSQLYSLYPVEKITPLFRKVKNPRSLDLVVFFSSKGFVGDFNQKMELFLKQLKRELTVQTFTVAVGNKAKNLTKKGLADLWLPSPLDAKGYLKEEVLKKLTNLIVERFKKEKTDKVILLYFTPTLKGIKETVSHREVVEEQRDFQEGLEIFYKPEIVLKKIKISPGGGYRPRLVEFLPPKIRKVEPTAVINIEGNEKRLIEELLTFYIRFALRFVIFEHLAAETVARLNTTSAVLQRAQRKLKEIKLKISKTRAELITEELGFLSTYLTLFGELKSFPTFGEGEEKILFLQKGWVIQNELKEVFSPNKIVYWNKLGFALLKINKQPNHLEPSYYLDLSVEGFLEKLLREF